MRLSQVIVVIACSVAACSMPQPAEQGDNGLIVLTNGKNLEVAISPHHGGELSGFKVRFADQWHELIYRARDYSGQPGWRGKASVLWPATGVSINLDGRPNHYDLDGATYEMPFHGFARNSLWKLVERFESEDGGGVLLQFSSSEVTRQNFPFEFQNEVEYQLTDDRLRITYTVRAGVGNSRSMPFSMGNHIAFKVPLVESPGGSELAFRHNLPYEMIVDERRAYSGNSRPNPYVGWNPLTVLPKRLAVSLGGASGAAKLELLDPSGLSLQLEHEVEVGPVPAAVDFNLWTDLDVGFFSPQPWAGAQNSLNTGLGVIRLAPGDAWRWRIEIRPGAAPIHDTIRRAQ